MSGLTTAELVLGPYWRDRIEHELANGPQVQTVEHIYDVVHTLPNTPTYAEAWEAVNAQVVGDASDVRRTTVQTMFDMVWQTLCSAWSPNGKEAGLDELSGGEPTVPIPVAA